MQEAFKPLSKEEKLQIFRSLFKGREDAFAQRWESADGTRSAYYPAHTNRDETSYIPLSNKYLEDHLRGNKVIGIYAILQDNTTHFIAADFDGSKW